MVLRARDLFEAELDPVLPPDQPDDVDDAFFNAKEVAMDGKGMVAFPGTPQSYEHGASISPWFRLERLYGEGGRSMWNGNLAKRVGNNTSVVRLGEDGEGNQTFGLLLHGTIVAKISLDKAVYNTGGWHTRTTVERINRVLFGGWHLSMLNGTLYWYNWEAKQGVMGSECRIPFTDGDSINLRTGTLTINGTVEPWPVRRRRKVLPEGHKAGVYADLTGDKADYYVKCPKCGSVSGTFKSKREAELNSTCGSCLFDEREATRKRLEKEGRPKKAKSRAESMAGRLLEDDGDLDDFDGFDAKQHAIAHGPTWADKLKAKLEARTGNSFDYAVANHSMEPKSRMFLVVRATRAPAYVLYRDTAAMQDDVFDSAYDRLVEAPEDLDDDLILRYVDFRQLISVLGEDDLTSNLRTKPDVVDYFSDVYGDAAIEHMLRIAPLSKARIEAAATDIATGDSDDMVYWLSTEGRADVTAADGSVAIQYYKLPRVVQDAFAQDEPDEP